MQVPGLTGTFGEHMNVDVDETVPDRRQVRDPGLFGHLPRRRGEKSCVVGIDMTSGLHPDPDLAVMDHEHPVPLWVDHECAGSEMPRGVLVAIEGIVRDRSKIEHLDAVPLLVRVSGRVGGEEVEQLRPSSGHHVRCAERNGQ